MGTCIKDELKCNKTEKFRIMLISDVNIVIIFFCISPSITEYNQTYYLDQLSCYSVM